MIRARKVKAICPQCGFEFIAAIPMPRGYGMTACISSSGSIAYTIDLIEHNRLNNFRELIAAILQEQGLGSTVSPQDVRRLYLEIAVAPDENGINLSEAIRRICPSCGSISIKHWGPIDPEETIEMSSVKADLSDWDSLGSTGKSKLISDRWFELLG
jgi:predicted RNA-binding Zn-ribbon protein involved in translation (DUF1610 family)